MMKTNSVIKKFLFSVIVYSFVGVIIVLIIFVSVCCKNNTPTIQKEITLTDKSEVITDTNTKKFTRKRSLTIPKVDRKQIKAKSSESCESIAHKTFNLLNIFNFDDSLWIEVIDENDSIWHRVKSFSEKETSSLLFDFDINLTETTDESFFDEQKDDIDTIEEEMNNSFNSSKFASKPASIYQFS